MLQELKINQFTCPEDFAEGCLLVIHKPLRWTSFDVVNRIKHRLKKLPGAGKMKVGHAGTLDPLATGLLIVCTGRMTKQIDTFTQQEKTYTGTIRLGFVTPSFDLETEPEDPRPTAHLTRNEIEKAMACLIGRREQMPPVFSAKKVDGKRAYYSARAGQAVNLRPAVVTISAFDIEQFRIPDIDFKVLCSKGTYIRSLAHELGAELGCGAHLTALCRTASGPFDLVNALTLEQFEQRLQQIEGHSTE